MLYEPFIDRTYFEGELTIGQVSQQEVEEELKLFIRKYEFEFLIKLLGKPLYEAFYAGMQGDTVEARWKALAYGKDFNVTASLLNGYYDYGFYSEGTPVSFRGLLRNPESDLDVSFLSASYGATSPIAKYIYYWWMRAKATSTGGVGESIQETNAGKTVSNSAKMTRYWNEMHDEVVRFYLFLDMNIADYPESNLGAQHRYYPGLINQFNFL